MSTRKHWAAGVPVGGRHSRRSCRSSVACGFSGGYAIRRWPPAPLLDGTCVDQWSAYDFVLPCVFLLRSSGYPAGTAELCPNGPDSIEPFYQTVTSQAVTPIIETSTIYYYSGGQLTRHSSEDRLRRQIEMFGMAFREDKAMIEAQQAVINRSPEKTMMTLSFDRSVGQFRRLIDGLIDGLIDAEAAFGRASAEGGHLP